MSSQRKIGALLSYTNIIVKNLVNFIYTPILLHYVGQSQYGLFQMTNSVIMSLSILSMGLSSAYVKFYMSYKISNKKNKIDVLNAIYLCMFIFISIFSLLISLFLAFKSDILFGKSLSYNEIELTRILMICLGLNLAITFPSSVFESNIIVNEQFKFQQLRQLGQSILVPIISIPLVILGNGVLVIALTQTCITLIFLILNASYCVRKLDMHFDFKNMSVKMLKPLFAFSFYILLNQIVDMVNNNAPSFILGMLLGAKDVATFAIAIQIKNMFFMLSTSLSSVFVPRVNELANLSKDKKDLAQLMVKVGRIQMSILFFVLGGFIVVGPYFIQVWAGSENLTAYILVILMVLPSVIPLSQNIGIEIQRAYNMHIFRSLTYTLFAGINLLLTFFGIKYFGLYGAPIGYVVSILCANGILMNWYYHNTMGLNMKFYWNNTLNVIIPFFLVTSTLKVITSLKPITSFLGFIILGCLYVVFYFFIFVRFIANDFEKKQIFFLKKDNKI